MNKQENVKVRIVKYAAAAAAAVCLGYILGNRETRAKLGSSCSKGAVELETTC